jgi:sortase (surface protein transpeptidase)
VLAGKVSSKVAVTEFKAARTATRRSAPSTRRPAAGDVDVSQWRGGRIQAYMKTATAWKKPAIGILRIPRLNVEAHIFEGTYSLMLNRGVGHIKRNRGPRRLGEFGDCGHRDMKTRSDHEFREWR